MPVDACDLRVVQSPENRYLSLLRKRLHGNHRRTELQFVLDCFGIPAQVAVGVFVIGGDCEAMPDVERARKRFGGDAGFAIVEAPKDSNWGKSIETPAP